MLFMAYAVVYTATFNHRVVQEYWLMKPEYYGDILVKRYFH